MLIQHSLIIPENKRRQSSLSNFATCFCSRNHRKSCRFAVCSGGSYPCCLCTVRVRGVLCAGWCRTCPPLCSYNRCQCVCVRNKLDLVSDGAEVPRRKCCQSKRTGLVTDTVCAGVRVFRWMRLVSLALEKNVWVAFNGLSRSHVS